ncbi:Kelch repeat-containing protein [Leptospira jelokensis]|uniref:Kelch-like protein n=1 Tax=Leptospira jelokensis TaxID=2484931 RepID=A0A4Z0ZX09_9LEPT|nr:kelch repeat-containing protein [Leptospira jelokensis]TGL62548.1 kelch-like protein [Leptospira jelokensis]
MNKLILPLLLLFVGCMVKAEFKNVFDPKTMTSILLSSTFSNEIFSCTERSNTKSFGNIDQILLKCNRELAKVDTEFLTSINEETFNNITFTKLGNDQLLVQFDPLVSDGKYDLKLQSVVSGFGETLEKDTFPIIIDTQLPTVSLSNYLPITDYTFFSERYWDFTSSEPLSHFSPPTLSGSLAPSIIIRSIQRISDSSFRVYFETNFISNGPGTLIFSFEDSKDKAQNPVTNSTTVRLIGLVKGPELNQGRSEFEGFQNQNGDVIAIYGYNASAEILRKGTNTFVLTNPSLPSIGKGERGVMLDGKKLLITGGFPPYTYISLSESYIFDTETTSFLPTGNMNQNRGEHNIVKLANGKVMVLGGISQVFPGSHFITLNSAEIYDPNTETFTELPNRMQSPRSFFCSVLLNDGRVFVVGGTNGIYAPMDTTEFFDPTTETFSFGPNLPIAVGALKCLKLSDGNVLIYGAQLSNLSNATMLFDVTKNRIITIANSVYRREWSIAQELPDGGILFYGGAYRYNTSEPSRTIEKLDYGKSNSFYDMGMARNSISKHSGVKFSDGTLFYLGGESGGMFHHGTDYYGLTE